MYFPFNEITQGNYSYNTDPFADHLSVREIISSELVWLPLEIVFIWPEYFIIHRGCDNLNLAIEPITAMG